ncbi:unnamed protein product, partial [Rotaria sordida]
GHDTIATAFNFALFIIALHQDTQQCLFEEMQSIFENDNKRVCTLDDIIQMDYLERIIKDTLRLLLSVPIVGRKIQETFRYDLFFFKYLSMKFIVIHDIFLNQKKFDPDRFLPKVAQQQHPYAYIPFSAGSQNCIGQRFALLEAKVFLSTIIHRFHLTTS